MRTEFPVSYFQFPASGFKFPSTDSELPNNLTTQQLLNYINL